MFKKDRQYIKFSAYGFLKNMRFFDPFILLFFREIGFSYLQIGFLFSIREIGNIIMEIPSGFVADAVGRKKAMLFAFAAYITAFLVFTTTSNYYLFMLAMLFFAAGEAFRSGTHKAMIIDYLKIHNMADLKTEYYGSTRAWSQRGSAISSLIAGTLVIISGNYRIIFFASIIPYLLDFINLATYPKILDGQSKTIKKQPLTVRDIFPILKKEEYRRGLLNSALYDGLFKSIKDYLQPIAQSFALGLPLFLGLQSKTRSAVIVALVYFILHYIAANASQNSHNLKTIFSSLRFAINITFIMGIFISIISGLSHTLHVESLSILFFITLFAMQNLRRPLNTDYISNHIPDQLMATGLSVETQLKTITIALLSPIIGFLADMFGVGIAISAVSLTILILYPFVKIPKRVSQF